MVARIGNTLRTRQNPSKSNGARLPFFHFPTAFIRRDQIVYAGITVGTIIFVLAIWWSIAALGIWPPLLLPSPEAVWNSFVINAFSGYQGHLLWYHLGVSLMRIGIAFIAAAIIAIPLGMLVARFRWLSAMLEPTINFYRVLPPLAYYMILVVWMGIGETSKVTLLGLAGFPPMFIAIIAAVRSVPQDRINAARCLGADNMQVLRAVLFPSILPDVITSMRVAMGFIYTTLVSAEMVASTQGIGWMVLDASRFLKTDVVFLGIFAMGVTGLILDGILKVAEARFVPWRGKE